MRILRQLNPKLSNREIHLRTTLDKRKSKGGSMPQVYEEVLDCRGQNSRMLVEMSGSARNTDSDTAYLAVTKQSMSS